MGRRTVVVDVAGELVHREAGRIRESEDGVRLRATARPPLADRDPGAPDLGSEGGVIEQAAERCRCPDVALEHLTAFHRGQFDRR